MENNNNYSQQAQYQQPAYQTPPQYQQPVQPMQAVDPNYMPLANDFLTKSIIAGVISSLPVGSFIALSMASKNRKKILEYIDNGGIHTIRIKISSAISRAAKYSAVGFSIFWGVYGTIWLVYTAIAVIGIIIAATSGNF